MGTVHSNSSSSNSTLTVVDVRVSAYLYPLTRPHIGHHNSISHFSSYSPCRQDKEHRWVKKIEEEILCRWVQIDKYNKSNIGSGWNERKFKLFFWSNVGSRLICNCNLFIVLASTKTRSIESETVDFAIKSEKKESRASDIFYPSIRHGSIHLVSLYALTLFIYLLFLIEPAIFSFMNIFHNMINMLA